VIVFYLSKLFSLWMLVDAAQRRIDSYWYFIILMPMGEWVYFFAVKIHDWDLSGWKNIFKRPPSLEELGRRAEETPSLENRMLHAHALLDAGKAAEAAQLYAEVLRADDSERDAMYGLARAQNALGAYDKAVAQLQRLVELDPTYRDYAAWLDLAYAHWQAVRPDDAIAVLHALVATSPRLKHKAILGRHLAKAGRGAEARHYLEQVLRDWRDATAFVRRTNGRWLKEAKKALKEVHNTAN
jgi:hypothetical protein